MRKRLTATLAVFVVLAMVSTGLLLWVLITDDGDGGASGTGGDGTVIATQGKTVKRTWASPVLGERHDTLGIWIHEDRVVTGDKDGIVARDIADGRELGKFTPPAGEFCGMTTEASRGIGIAMYGRGDECDTTIAVDLASMTSPWEKRSKGGDGTESYRVVHTAVDGDIVVLSTATGFSGYDIKDGSERWAWTAPSDKSSSFNSLRAENGTVLVGRTTYQSGISGLVVAIDASDGSQKWTYEVPAPSDGYVLMWLVSASPAIIQIARDDDYFLQVFDDSGQKRTEIPQYNAAGYLTLSGSVSGSSGGDFATEYLYAPLIDKDTLYVIATQRNADVGEMIRLVAIDLGTGKDRWSRPLGADTSGGVILGADDSGIRVLLSGLPGVPAKFVTFAAGDGSVRDARSVDGKAFYLVGFSSRWIISEEHLVGVKQSPRADDSTVTVLA